MDRTDPPHDPTRVRDTYEHIAHDFDRTRERPWPAVERFIKATAHVDTALDLGCGNGRHLDLLANRAERVVGIDVSRAMLTVASQRVTGSVQFLEASARWLPLRSGSVDLAIYIATMHHLPSPTDRIASLDQIAEVLSGGGRVLVSVWSVSHERFDATEAFDTLVDWTLPDGETVPRYYHIYDHQTFSTEIEASQFDIVRLWQEAGNLYAHLEVES